MSRTYTQDRQLCFDYIKFHPLTQMGWFKDYSSYLTHHIGHQFGLYMDEVGVCMATKKDVLLLPGYDDCRMIDHIDSVLKVGRLPVLVKVPAIQLARNKFLVFDVFGFIEELQPAMIVLDYVRVAREAYKLFAVDGAKSFKI